MAKAESVMDSYKRIETPSAAHSQSRANRKQQQWIPPPRGWLKINVDAATNFEKKSAGLRVVVRDSNGNIISAGLKTSKFRGDVTYAEAEAVEWGLQIAKSMEVPSIVVETDSQVASDLLNSKQSSRTEVYWVISEV